jgi:hypothetical protein
MTKQIHTKTVLKDGKEHTTVHEETNVQEAYDTSSRYLVTDIGVVVVIWCMQLDLQLHMQSVPITINIVSLNPTQERCTPSTTRKTSYITRNRDLKHQIYKIILRFF